MAPVTIAAIPILLIADNARVARRVIDLHVAHHVCIRYLRCCIFCTCRYFSHRCTGCPYIRRGVPARIAMTLLHDAFADVLGDSKRLVAGWLRLKPSYTLSITAVIFLCCERR